MPVIMIRSRNKKPSLLFSLALLAFLVRSLIPAGFMPVHGAGNTYPLVICSGYGPVTIHVTADKLPQAPPQPAHGSDNMSCPYAQVLAQGMLVDYPVLPLPPAAGPVLAYAEKPLLLNTAVKNYFSNGPPSFPA
jgi:hypothetical protein